MLKIKVLINVDLFFCLSLCVFSSFCFCFRYGDMRRLIGFAIRDIWYKLGKKYHSINQIHNIVYAIDKKQSSKSFLQKEKLFLK